MLKKKQKRHACWGWCGQRILGIIENQKLIGEIPQEFEVELRCVIGLTFIPGGAIQLTCQHRRLYILVDKR